MSVASDRTAMITVVKVTSDRESERRNAAAFFVIRVKVAPHVPIKQHGQESGRVKTEGSRAATADRSELWPSSPRQDVLGGERRTACDGIKVSKVTKPIVDSFFLLHS